MVPTKGIIHNKPTNIYCLVAGDTDLEVGSEETIAASCYFLRPGKASVPPTRNLMPIKTCEAREGVKRQQR